MKVFCLCCVTLCLTGVVAASATASAESYAFNASGTKFSATGSLTAVADPTLAGAFDVTGISGSVTFGADTQTITGLLSCAAYSPSSPCSSTGPYSFGYDDLLYPSGTAPFYIEQVDDRGIGFAIGSAGAEGDFYASSSHHATLVLNGEPGDATPLVGSFTVTPTPEPASFALLGTGLCGMAGAVRRRRVR